MFDKPYTFSYKGVQPAKGEDDFIELHTYTFQSETEKYIVRAERFSYEVVTIKFYPKRYEKSPNRYRLLTGERHASRILGTILRIMVDVVKKYEATSLAFVGAELPNEAQDRTKRYKLYKEIMIAFFAPVNFSHHPYPTKSIYLILNRKNKNPEILRKIEQMFTSIFMVESKIESDCEAKTQNRE